MKKGCLIGGAIGVVFLGGLMLIGLAVAAVQFGWVSVPWKRPTPPPVTRSPASGPTPGTYSSPGAVDASSPSSAPVAADSTAPAADENFPHEAAFRQLLNGTMTMMKNAMRTGNFEPVYRSLSDHRKKEAPTTAEKLKAEWQEFADMNYDLDSILQIPPVFEPAPITAADGALVLEGYYPNADNNMNLTFKVWYHPQNGAWTLSYITAQMKPPGAQPEVPPGTADTGKTFVSTLDNIPAALKAQFVPFSFAYPPTFATVVPDQNTFVNIKKGEAVSFAVHPASFPAGRNAEAAYKTTLSAVSDALRKSFPSFKEVRRGTETVAGVRSRTMSWQASTGNVTLYGKCYVLRKENKSAGVLIAVISTSLDTPAQSASDIGTTGDLAEIVGSFKLL